MRILFDHGTPRSIAFYLEGHTVKETRAQGWDRLTNGELLKAAEETGFDLLPLFTARIVSTPFPQ